MEEADVADAGDDADVVETGCLHLEHTSCPVIGAAVSLIDDDFVDVGLATASATSTSF